MTLRELRQLFEGDYTFVKLMDEDYTEVLEEYNGRDNLTDKYNDCHICSITGEYDYNYHHPFIAVRLDNNDVMSADREEWCNKRENIIWGEDYNCNEYAGGCRHFEDLTIDAAEELVKEGFLRIHDSQNCSPTTEEMMDFVRHTVMPKDWVFDGYAISPARVDCRVTLEGLYYIGKDLPQEDMIDFANAFHYADEFQIGHNTAMAWWD